MPPIVETRGLTRQVKRAGKEHAILSDLSFQVETNEFLCIMGPSGSGKTTLLHLLAGLDQPSGGTVLIEGKALEAMKNDERALLRRSTIGQVFQFFNLMPALNLRENIELPLAIAGRKPSDSKADVDALIKSLALEHRAEALPSELSGGEMQRCSIARALAGGQPLLVCDEPTGNLSQQAGLEVMQILRNLKEKRGKSILLVTHNPRDAAFADRVLFLLDGKLDPKHELRGPDIQVEQVHAALAELDI